MLLAYWIMEHLTEHGPSTTAELAVSMPKSYEDVEYQCKQLAAQGMLIQKTDAKWYLKD